ncbi:MAG: class I lanthipeptide [Kofleriaceae bacterium]
MKKTSTHKIARTRKLMLHREAIAALTLPQLAHVAGGAEGGETYWHPCPETNQLGVQ